MSPTRPAVHEAVREVIPDARVAYVDIDAVAVTHGQALLAKGVGLATHRADLTEPDTVLGAPELPGVVEARRWLAGIAAPPPTEGLYVLYGAGIKRLRSCRSACGA